MKFRGFWHVSGVQKHTLLLAAFLCVVFAGFELHKSFLGSLGYVLVIDCGSTGTRLHAYQWQDQAGRLPLLRPVSTKAAQHKIPPRSGAKRAYERVETEPGLDSFLHDLPGLKARALDPLLQWAAAVVPRRLHSSTPVFLLGTAGLRRLDSEPLQRLLAEAQAVLGASPFRFQHDWAIVITGEQEGLYGWIALNYLTGRLRAHPLAPAANESLDLPHPMAPKQGKRGDGNRKGPVGALDLGGSSLEVTYPLSNPAVSAGSQANVSIMEATYQLQTHAYPGLGLNDAFTASVAYLLASQATLTSQDDSHQTSIDPQEAAEDVLRASAGAEERRGTRSILQHEPGALSGQLPQVEEEAAAAKELEHPCLQEGFSRPYSMQHADPNLPSTVILVGRPDWASCERLAAAVIDASPLCSDGECALAGTLQQQEVDFYALTGFYVVFHFFRLPASAGIDQLLAAGQRYCGEPWAAVPPARRQEIHAESYCFRAPFVADLLRRGLRLDRPRLRIGSGDQAWTLGAALAQGSAVRSSDPVVAAALTGAAPPWVQLTWQLLLVACLLWLACLVCAHIRIGAAHPITPPDSLHLARRVGLDGLADVLPRSASRARSTSGGLSPEDPHLYHTGGTARFGSTPLPSLGQISVAAPESQLPSAPHSPGGFFWSPSTRAIGGSFNSNVHWLSSQRKRNMSQDNLEEL